jgi:hypothetical protein
MGVDAKSDGFSYDKRTANMFKTCDSNRQTLDLKGTKCEVISLALCLLRINK